MSAAPGRPAGERPPSLRDQLRRAPDEARDVRDEFAGIIADLGTLLEKEAELARTEVREQTRLSLRSAGLAVGAAVSAILTITFLALTLMFILDERMDLWAAALITTLVLVGVTGILGWTAYEGFRRVKLVPERTMHSLREDLAWTRRQLSLS